ncbi:Uncharacterised protein [Mycobacteroides abscessus subsp. abscessus]|uniref:hypothetical protein n=1 Tax=Mycobacteroides abscessus TaxID=36809 RepID=UPI000927B407|nr:hypothetical protein [Mycobacteroides abscessus]MDO3312488.1 hypothetical protein [Mycobacteroides abscessus subsp. abscessus]MDO3344830.1 hypothetical protein [Mycobacteroides abscessus subsp. abscessus]SHP06302.1 Uncharacterised protein [Mycobacteroides abscessus subsp. abscessus]SHP20850.1 Uncharacterised protein [Mycobacteroides abscessus subsp. abscessus]SHP91747.1 Uncharacterised protein [Mycobacteroides abscessus subsp. abscessus]
MSRKSPLPLTERHPWIALLGWLPPVYVVGLFANSKKPWVHGDWLFDIGGNTPIFWWPTRLYKHRKWQRSRWAGPNGGNQAADGPREALVAPGAGISETETRKKGNPYSLWSFFSIPPLFLALAAPITALFNPVALPLLVLVALVLTGVIGAIVGITYLLVEVVVWPTDRRFATPEISLTPHQIGEYASAALQLETLADDLDAGTIAADTAAKHLACILDVLSEADPALRGPLEAKADLILATNYTDSEQLRRFLAFIRRHALRGHGL